MPAFSVRPRSSQSETACNWDKLSEPGDRALPRSTRHPAFVPTDLRAPLPRCAACRPADPYVRPPLRSGHLLDQLATARLLDRRLKLRSEIDAHLLGSLLRPHPHVARVAIERIVARLRRVETRQPRRLALDHRKRRHHPPHPRRLAMRTPDTLAPPRRTHHDVRADQPASRALILKNRHRI